MFFAQALSYADTTALMPVEFTRLIWASVVGYFMFTELPGIWAWIGGAVIFASRTLFNASYSREAENDADRFAIEATNIS